MYNTHQAHLANMIAAQAQDDADHRRYVREPLRLGLRALFHEWMEQLHRTATAGPPRNLHF